MKAKIIIFILLIILSILFIFAQDKSQKRIMTHEDMIAMKRIGTPTVSPDGKFIVFPLEKVDYDEKKNESDLWIVEIDGKNLRQLTTHKGAERGASWSPCGKKIAFSAKRGDDESNQIYILDLERGGEAYRITNVYTGASSPKFSPDGKWIAFISSVYPDCPDQNCNRERDKKLREKKSSEKVYETYPFRTWMEWDTGKRAHIFIVSSEGGEEKDLLINSSIVKLPGWGGINQWEWTPDSKGIVFSATVERDKSVNKYPSTDLYFIGIEGGEAKKLTTNPYNDFSPKFSPDGKYLLYLSTETDKYTYSTSRLTLMEWGTGKIQKLCSTWDASPSNPVWSLDGKTIYFNAEDGGANKIWKINLSDAISGKNPVEIAGKPGTWEGVYPALNGVVSLRERTTMPPEIFYVKESGEITQVTDFNREIREKILWNEAEEIYFNYGGRKIQAWMVKPPDFDPKKKYPLLYIIHGGPYSPWHDGFHYRWNMQLFASKGYVVVAPNPTGSPGFGEKFAREIQGDWGGRVYRELMAGVDYLLKNFPFIDKDKIACAGASYGGYMANWILGQTDRFKCIITHASLFNLTSMMGASDVGYFIQTDAGGYLPWKEPEKFEKFSPHRYVENFKTPTLVIHGELDYRVPVTQAFELFYALKKKGVPARLLYFPDEGHWILKPENSRKWYEEIFNWLDRWLK